MFQRKTQLTLMKRQKNIPTSDSTINKTKKELTNRILIPYHKNRTKRKKSSMLIFIMNCIYLN